MSGKKFFIADVFAEAPFSGNQLGVFPDARGMTTDEMQRAANELNYSETTFLLPAESDDTDLRLRIFTPRVELPFAGHPCVGTGFVVVARELLPGAPQVVRFGTGVGPIEVRGNAASEQHGTAVMGQPLPRLVAEIDDPGEIDALATALGTPAAGIAERSPVAVFDNGLRMMIVPAGSLDAVRALRPNHGALAAFAERHDARTMLVFTTETVEEDSSAHCRVFAPGAGVAEDPATGSANGPFGVYLSRYGLATDDEIVSEQGYEMGRPSILRISLGRDAAGEIDAVRVGGGVFITAEGTFFI